MATVLHTVGTAFPAHRYAQSFVRTVMGRWLDGDRRTQKLLDRVYRASAIDVRHSVVGDFLLTHETSAAGGAVAADPAVAGGGGPAATMLAATTPGDRPAPLFVDPDTGAFRSPGTRERNARYALEAGPLAIAAARDALRKTDALGAADVTHLVTVSCTGFATPGVDLELVAALGLRHDVARTHVGFMGCFAAFPALRLARAFCAEDPEAVVLVVCVELCTLHLQPSPDVDAILSNSVFADGAAAALLSARAPDGGRRALRLDATSTAVTRGGGDAMAWTIGDHGFDMTLTAYVPRVLEAEAAGVLAPLLQRAGVGVDDVPWWAVHPGGRAIVDKVTVALGLPETAVAASREVLRTAGNMSSATVLVVLERLMDRELPGPAAGEAVAALAFGPGLTVDGALFRAWPAA